MKHYITHFYFLKTVRTEELWYQAKQLPLHGKIRESFLTDTSSRLPKITKVCVKQWKNKNKNIKLKITALDMCLRRAKAFLRIQEDLGEKRLGMAMEAKS